jgi:hypothetical protein
MFHNIILVYGEELLAARPNPKLKDHPVSAVCYCLLNVLTATLHNWRPFLHPQPKDAPYRGDRDPLNTVTGTHLTRTCLIKTDNFCQFTVYLNIFCILLHWDMWDKI